MALSRTAQQWPDEMVIEIPEITSYYVGSPDKFENLVILDSETETERDRR